MSLSNKIGNKVEEVVLSGQSDTYLDKLDYYSKHPATVNKLTDAIHSLDQTGPMKAFRKHWNKLPHSVQWLVMHATKGPNMLSGSGPVQTFIKFGLLDYKGHQDENGQIMEQKIQAMGGFDKVALKYGVKLGKYFIPELAAVEPYVDPLLKLTNITDNLLSKTRQNVRALREEIELPEKNIKKISHQTESKVLHALPPLNLSPTKAANDNAKTNFKKAA